MTATPTRPAEPYLGRPTRTRKARTTGRALGIVTTAALLVVGALPVLAGAGVAGVSTALRGDDGRYPSAPTHWSSPGYAVRSEPVRMHGPVMTDLPRRLLGAVEITVLGRRDKAVFVGLARSSDVDRAEEES